MKMKRLGRLSEEALILQAQRAVQNVSTAFTAQQGVLAVAEAAETATRIKKVAQQFQNCTPESLGGRLAEEWHAGTFSVDAARKGVDDLRAHTTASAGQPTALADIVITRAGERVGRAQVKYCGSVHSTTAEISRNDYTGMQKIVPADQQPHIRSLAKSRRSDGLGGRDYADTSARASAQLEHEGVKSRPLSSKDAVELGSKAGAVGRRMVMSESARVVGKAAGVGALMGGGTAAVQQVLAVRRGETTGKAAARIVAEEAAVGALAGAASAAATLAVRTVLKGNAPLAAGMLAADVARDVVALRRGQIDGAEFGKRSAESAGRTGGTLAGLQAGAAIGTLLCPGVGTAVGGVVGSMVGGFGGGALASAVMRRSRPTSDDSTQEADTSTPAPLALPWSGAWPVTAEAAD